MSKQLGERVAHARIAAGFDSQDAFAAAIGARQATVSGWEAGASEPSAHYLRKIAEVANVSVDWLLGLSIDRDTDAEHTIRVIRKLVAVTDDVQHTGWYLAPEPVGIAHDDLTLRQAA